jgi:hypothetical protein
VTNVFDVPADIARITQNHLRFKGATREEGVVLWRGTLDPARITAAIVPAQETSAGRFRVPLAERQRITRELAGTGEAIVAQVHSHPRRAFHSPIDDEEAIPRRVGSYSLVVPDFGAREDLLDDAALFRLDDAGAWRPTSLGAFRLPRPKGLVQWLVDTLKNFGRSRT